MTCLRPVLRHAWWTRVHRALAVTLAAALVVVSVAGGHAADHHHGNEASTATIACPDVTDEPANCSGSPKCHLAGNCGILGLPGTEYLAVPAARQQASFISVRRLWQSLDLPSVFKPPIT